MLKAVTEQISGNLGKALSLKPGKANAFAAQAKRSDIGGAGVDFKSMSLDDQNQFINSYNNANVGGGTSTSERLVKQTRTGSESLSPQEKMKGYNVRRNYRDEGLEPRARRKQAERATQEKAEAKRIEDGAARMQQKIDKQGGNIEGYYEPAPRSVPRKVTGESHQKLGSSNPRSATPFDVNQSKPIAERAVEAAPGKPNLIQRMFDGLAGDTSGRAAAEAGQNFDQTYKNVFSSEATAEAFGVEQSVLKDAFGKSGDEFAEVLKKGGLDDEGVKGLEAFRGEVKRVGDEGGQLSEEGMQSMLKNQGEIGNMYGGFSRAGATASPNALLRGMGGEGTGMESIMGIAAVAGLAGGANVAMGGDFTEGAAVGGLGALSVKGIAKGVAGSMGDIEGAMMKNILGDDMTTAGARKTLGETVEGSYSSGTELSSIPKGSGLTLDDLGISRGTKAADTSLDDFTASVRDDLGVDKTNLTAKTSGSYSRTPEVMENVSGSQARRENLTAIQKMGDDDERLKGFGKKKMRDMLNPNKEKNVAMNNRALVLGGGMLSGVAFTGNADRRDYRRGFNAHRGNRI